MGVAYSAYCRRVSFMSWYEVYVRPHYCLPGRSPYVHSNIEAVDFSLLDFFISIIVCHAEASANKVRIVFFWDEQSMSFYAGIPVIEHICEI